MGKKIPIGIEFYKEMVDKDYYYVDKTLLIKDILDAGTKVSLFTRPRCFGKTLSLMKMSVTGMGIRWIIAAISREKRFPCAGRSIWQSRELFRLLV